MQQATVSGLGTRTITTYGTPVETMEAMLGHIERWLREAGVDVEFVNVEPSEHDPLYTIRLDIVLNGKEV